MTDPNPPAGTYSAPIPSENLDGSLIYSEQHAGMGIMRSVAEVFTVGSYRYTNLADAISQAKRNGAENE